jgi:DNA-binding GntR family transcriptional regulator
MKLPLTIKNPLVENLRDEIIAGKLMPGQHLRLEEIAARFEISTMPVREALRALEAEGLVEIIPHRGSFVVELSADDLQDIYDIRAELEAMATRLAISNMTEATCNELNSLINQMDDHIDDVVALVKLNNQFHETLYKLSNRTHLLEIIHNLRLRTRHYLRAYIAELTGMPVAQDEHRALIESCMNGDVDLASNQMREHVLHAGKAVIDYVGEHYKTGK